MRDKKAFPPSRVASCVWSTDAVRVCTRWCVRLVTGDRRVCVSVRVYTNGSDTHYICSLAALRQANFGKFSRAARAGKFSFKFSKTQVCPNSPLHVHGLCPSKPDLVISRLGLKPAVLQLRPGCRRDHGVSQLHSSSRLAAQRAFTCKGCTELSTLGVSASIKRVCTRC